MTDMETNYAAPRGVNSNSDTNALMIQIPRYLEVYIATLNSELDRFWSRFNMFAGVQVVAVVGLLLAFDQVQIHPHTARAANMLLFLWSLTGALIIWRSTEIQQRLATAIVAAETALPDDVSLFREALKATHAPQMFILRACFSFSLVCSMFWGGMIFLGPYS